MITGAAGEADFLPPRPTLKMKSVCWFGTKLAVTQGGRAAIRCRHMPPETDP